MQISRILLSLYVGFILYLGFYLFMGDSGFEAIEKLEAYKVELSENMEELNSINTELQKRFDALTSAPELVQREARELGYLQKNEAFLKIEHFQKPQDINVVGRVLRPYETAETDMAIYRAIAASLAIVFYFLSGPFFRRKHDIKNRRPVSATQTG